MGFGTLFFGYFLLLNNVAYCGFTDPIAALILLMGFYKLTGVNRYFRYSVALSMGFAVFSFGELAFSAVEIFMPTASLLSVAAYVSMARSAIVALLTALMLRGIWDVAEEVELTPLAKKSRAMIPVSVTAYALMILMDAPSLVGGLPSPALAVLSLIVVLGIPTVVIINLTVIHGAYMMICMPDEESNRGEKKQSRFSFINEFRRRRAEREAEDMEYRIERAKMRKEKKSK